MSSRHEDIINYVLVSFLEQGTVESVLKAVETLHKNYGTDRDIFLVEHVAVEGVISQAARDDDQEFLINLHNLNRWNSLFDPALQVDEMCQRTMQEVNSKIQKSALNEEVGPTTNNRNHKRKL